MQLWKVWCFPSRKLGERPKLEKSEEKEEEIKNVIKLNEITQKVKAKITKRIRIILELCTEFLVSKNMI